MGECSSSVGHAGREGFHWRRELGRIALLAGFSYSAREEGPAPLPFSFTFAGIFQAQGGAR